MTVWVRLKATDTALGLGIKLPDPERRVRVARVMIRPNGTLALTGGRDIPAALVILRLLGPRQTRRLLTGHTLSLQVPRDREPHFRCGTCIETPCICSR